MIASVKVIEFATVDDVYHRTVAMLAVAELTLTTLGQGAYQNSQEEALHYHVRANILGDQKLGKLNIFLLLFRLPRHPSVIHATTVGEVGEMRCLINKSDILSIIKHGV